MKLSKWTNLAATMVALTLVPQLALAADGSAGLGAGMAMGLAVIGGGLGQGLAAKGYYESVSRNPQVADTITGNFFVGLAFIESLVLFTFVIAFLLQGHIA